MEARPRRRLGPHEADRVLEHLGVAEHAARAFASRTIDREERLGIAYLALCTAALAWRPGRGPFAAYAYGTCRREILKAFRGARVRFHWHLDDRMLARAVDEGDGGRDAARAEGLDWVEGQLRTMNARRRRLVDLYLQGLSPAEIAREAGETRVHVLGVLKGVVRTLKGRAMRELKPCG